MIDSILEVVGLEAADLPFFGDQILLIFTLCLIFFGSVLCFNLIFDLILGIFRKER